MYQFKIKPSIYEFETVSEFVENFEVFPGDTVFTEKFFYEKYLKGKLDCNFIFQDDYGLGEPSDVVIDRILADIKGKDIKRFIGIGGGSVLDITKLLCLKDATTTADIFDERIPLIREKGLVLIPTTCGTGCEVTCVSVVDMTRRKTKMGKRVEANFADSAILIDELLDGIPEKVFIYSSVDALIHAMEIFVAPTGNPYNDVFCKEAIRIILGKYKVLTEEGLDKRFNYIDEFLRASNYAGIALSNITCGAVHALAMHFGSVYHVPHGESNARFLTAVFNKYAELAPEGKLRELADIINQALGIEADIRGSFLALEKLIEKILPSKKLGDYGVKEGDIESYVDKVIETQQRLLINNYVKLSREDLIDIYREAL
jgi:4-hydroxybutyrate dehydrogenase